MPLLETRASASAQGYGLFGGATSTGNFFLISQQTPSAVSTITFNSIPSTYKHLMVRFNLVFGTAGGYVRIKLNGDTTVGNYASHYLTGNGNATGAVGSVSTFGYFPLFVYTGILATYPNVGIVDIIDYANANKNKTIKALAGNNNSPAGSAEIDSGVWLSTSAITSLTVDATNTFTGTISLYGVS